MMARPTTDKGRARRDSIVEAAADLLLSGGPPAVTHRAVANRAGVPLGSTTYYFAGRDELLAAAIEQARSTDVARARRAAGEPPGPGPLGLARRLVDVVVGHGRLAHPDRVAAQYLGFLGVARTAAGRMSVGRWNRELREAVADTLRRHRTCGASADVVLALVDGCVLAWLVEEALDAGTEALVGRVLDGVVQLGLGPAEPGP